MPRRARRARIPSASALLQQRPALSRRRARDVAVLNRARQGVLETLGSHRAPCTRSLESGVDALPARPTERNIRVQVGARRGTEPLEIVHGDPSARAAAV